MKKSKFCVMACLLFVMTMFAVQSGFGNEPPKKDQTVNVYEKDIVAPVVAIVEDQKMDVSFSRYAALYEKETEVGLPETIPLREEVTINDYYTSTASYDNILKLIAQPPAWQNVILGSHNI